MFLVTNGEEMKAFNLVVASLFTASVTCGQTLPGTRTPAEQKIAWAEASIKAHADHSQPYNDLAVAYIARARETADPGYYDRAEDALRTSFGLIAENLEGEKAQIMVLQGRGEFSRAFDLARTFNKKTPDDLLLYGFIADAAVELGEYPEAENAVQWMLDMRPGNVPGLLRGAALRRLYGDIPGALQFFSQAYQQMAPTQTEELAWTLTQMADAQLSVGHVDDAEALLRSALQKFPAYYLAQESLAGVQMARRHYSEAAQLLQQRNQSFPTAASRYALARAFEHAGQAGEAETAYREFEATAHGQRDSAMNANRELVAYDLDRGHNPAEALQIARGEIAKRHDIRTLDAYAWALHANGQDREAQKQVSKAIAVGVRDALIFYHAGVIAEGQNDLSSAAHFLKVSLETNPEAETATAARAALDRLTAASAEVRSSK
jgi:tetratricopeptide (TPR) repeat protein